MTANSIHRGSKSNYTFPRALCDIVQKNCDISDARYAGDYSLCTYLLKMREYYRWEQGITFGTKLPHEVVGEWVEKRERKWDQLETTPYSPLRVTGHRFDPFDNDGINRELLPRGLVYSGGYGRFRKPHFFLGRLLRIERFRDYTVLVSADEYARDLTAPPAMTRDSTIFVRRESLRRMVWEKVEDWQWKKTNRAMTRAMTHYDIEHDLEGAIEQITENELETIILHELGEILAGDLLGDSWNEMLAAVSRTPAEIMVRAFRDQLSDCLSTLPALFELENLPSIHFYFANLNGMRKELCPTLVRNYQRWVDTDNLAELRKSVPIGKQHWSAMANSALRLHDAHGGQCVPHIESLMESARL